VTVGIYHSGDKNTAIELYAVATIWSLDVFDSRYCARVIDLDDDVALQLSVKKRVV
jgi:hypothetical protein